MLHSTDKESLTIITQQHTQVSDTVLVHSECMSTVLQKELLKQSRDASQKLKNDTSKKFKTFNNSESCKKSSSMTSRGIGMRWMPEMLPCVMRMLIIYQTQSNSKWNQTIIGKSQIGTMSTCITNLISDQSKLTLQSYRISIDSNQISPW